jgi:hypothetical protein
MVLQLRLHQNDAAFLWLRLAALVNIPSTHTHMPAVNHHFREKKLHHEINN